MNADLITHVALGLIIVWAIVCVAGALVMARDRRWEPLPPEEPDHH